MQFLEGLFTFQSFFTLLMLVLLQAVLGFDNLLYISIESKRVEASQQSKVRRLGIGDIERVAGIVRHAFAGSELHGRACTCKQERKKDGEDRPSSSGHRIASPQSVTQRRLANTHQYQRSR